MLELGGTGRIRWLEIGAWVVREEKLEEGYVRSEEVEDGEHAAESVTLRIVAGVVVFVDAG
jgi:hypothetical protein